MAKTTNALTIPKLISAMKKAGFPTKKEFKNIVAEQFERFKRSFTLT